MILFELFLSFLKIGLFSIGGGLAAMPLIQAQIVTKHEWLTLSDFTDLVTIAEMTPGPIAINSATFVGLQVGGILGAIVASFAVILPACFIVSFLYFIYNKYKGVNTFQNVLASLRPTVAALIASAGLTILQLVVFGEGKYHIENLNWIGIIIFILATLTLRKTNISPIIVMLLSGLVGLILSLIFI